VSHPILLTGASGFIGGRLAQRLVARGDAVRCLVRASSDTRRLESLAGVEFVRGDLTDTACLPAAVAGAEAVVHCAAMVSDWGTVDEIRAVNATAAAELARAAVAAGVTRFIHISTTDIYGHPGGRGVSEDHVPTGFANWYAQTKREAEFALSRICSEAGMELVILRPATVYGPGSTEVVGELATALRGGYLPLVAGGHAVAGLVYVDNLADAVELALTRSAAVGEAFNISDGLDVTWRRFIGDLASGLGVAPPRLRLPGSVALGLGVVMERGYRAVRRRTGLQTAPLLSRQAVQVLARDQDFSSQKLTALLGWTPRVSYEDGMAATLTWLREEYFGGS
jgi:nucleoside-diphosphate-sugar epimerase